MEKGVGARVLGIFRAYSGHGCGEEEVELRAGSVEMEASSWERGGLAQSVSISPPIHLPPFAPYSTSTHPEKTQTQGDPICLFPDYSSF